MPKIVLSLIALFLIPGGAKAAGIDKDELAKIDSVVESALKRNDCPGAVVLVIHGDKVVLRKAYGSRVVKPEKVQMTVDAVFDMASLTKPVATGTSIMLLIEQGKLKPSDPVAKHWPAFAANAKDAVTVEHLLLHTSGLIADNPIADYQDGREKAIERIAELKTTRCARHSVPLLRCELHRPGRTRRATWWNAPRRVREEARLRASRNGRHGV